jgi:hypothetical protein
MFRYQVDPRLDLPSALGAPAVRDAFARCAAHPGDALAQARAVAALRGTEPGTETDRAPDPGVPVPGCLVPSTDPLDGVAVLHDCREIAVGNVDRQFDTGAFVLAPTDTTGELLRCRPEIVQAVVDRSCQVGGSPGGRIRRSLAAAVCADAPRP